MAVTDNRLQSDHKLPEILSLRFEFTASFFLIYESQ
jgi:hypothetical protein